MKYTLISLSLSLIFFWQGCDNPFQNNPEIGLIKNYAGEVKYFPMWDPESSPDVKSDRHIVITINDINKRPLYSLDKLVVAKNSFLHLHFYDHGDVYLGDSQTETVLIIKKPEDGDRFKVLADLTKGIMNCFIDKKDSRFAVLTPTAVAGVLGTQFRVEVKNEKTVVTVIESSKGVEIENVQQKYLRTIALRESQQIAIPHKLHDALARKSGPSGIAPAAAEGEPPVELTGIMPVIGTVVSDSSPSHELLSWDELTPKQIETNNYEYPVGVNAAGQLDFKKFIEYSGRDRVKTYDKD